MKLAKYLADYIEHEVTEGDNRLIAWDNLDFKQIIQQGIEAFASTEDVQILVAAGNDNNIVERIA